MHILSGRKQFFQILNVYPIITVHKADPLAVAVRKRPVDTRVPGSRQTTIFLMNDMHTAVLCSVFIADHAAVVRAAVVHEDQLEVRKRLRENAVHAAAKVGFNLVDGDNNRDLSQFNPTLS